MDGLHFEDARLKQQDMLAQAQADRLVQIALEGNRQSRPQILQRLWRALRPAAAQPVTRKGRRLIPAEQGAG
jgi:hypothetical protein